VVFDATGDGLPDLAACNNGSNNLTLLEAGGSAGWGDGSFVLAGMVATASSPRDLVTHDFDADAILDFAVVHEADASVGFYGGGGNDGRGDAVFVAAWSAATGASPQGLTAADIDGDRISDLIVANSGSGQAGIFVADGSNARGLGSFAGQVTYAAGSNPVAVAAADLDDDKIADLIAVDQAGALSTRLGGGVDGEPTGSFGSLQTTALSGQRAGLALGDLNEDGILDLVVVNSTAGEVDVLLGDGAGGFSVAAAVTVGAEPVHVLLTDLNADGSLDLAVANRTAATVSVRLGAGNGAFSGSANFVVGAGPVMLAAGDFNEDGLRDLVTANHAGASISVLLGQGGGNFAAAAQLDLGGEPSAVVVGHFDWDGRLDLAVTDQDGDAILILRGQGVCSALN